MYLKRNTYLLLFTLLFGQVYADDFVPSDESDVTISADTFTLDGDDTGGDVSLEFGGALGEALQWDSANNRFSLSDSIDLQGNQLLNIRIDNQATAPTCAAPDEGKIYFNTADKLTYSCDGAGTWNPFENALNATIEFPLVQARRTTSFPLTTTYTDVDLDVTDLENDATTLDHDDTLRDRINIGADGLYQIIYGYTAGGTATATHEARARVRANDTLVLSGSQSVNRNYQVEFSTTSASFLTNLTSGDFISLQLQRDATPDDTQDEIYFSIVKLEGIKGEKGDKGDPGSAGNGTDEFSFTLDQDNTGAGADVSFIANQGTDNNGVWRYNSTDNRWEVSNDGGTFIPIEPADGLEDMFYAYDAAGNTVLASTPVDITFDTEVREDASYTHAADSAEITINNNGNYSINYECTPDVSDGDRSLVEHFLLRDTGGGFSEVAGTRAASYHRTVGDGRDTASINHYMSLNAGDVIKFQAQGDSNGNLSTVPNACRVKIHRLDTGQGLIGPQGPQGPPGADGVSGGGWGEDGVTTTTTLDAQIDGTLQVNGNVNSDCGPHGVFWAERGGVSSNNAWAMGNGQGPWGSPMGCSGTVQRFAATCTGTIGTSLGAEVRVNDVSTACNVNIPAVVGGVGNTSCNVSFGANDIVGVYAQTENGNWTTCVGTFWVKYD